MIKNFIKYSCEKNTKNLDEIINIDSIFRYKKLKEYCKTDYYCANLQYVRDVDSDKYKATLYNYNFELKSLNNKLFNEYPKDIKINMMLQYILFFGHMAYEHDYFVLSNNISVLNLDENIHVLYKIGKTLYRLEVSNLLIFSPNNIDNESYSIIIGSNEEHNVVEFMLMLGENESTFLEVYIYSKEFSEIISYEKYEGMYGKNITFKNYINMLFDNESIYQSNKDLRDFKYDKTLCKN